MATKKIRLGGFGFRADMGGLGTQTQEFYNHIPCDKVLVVTAEYACDYSKFPNATITGLHISSNEIEPFLKDLDVAICFETPYNWEFFNIAKEMGVKTILQPNYEWLPNPMPSIPDLLIPPSMWHFDEFPEPKVYLPAPVNRKLIPFKLRKKADIFLHIAGHKDTSYGRNGTREFLDAIPLVKANVKFIIHTQTNFDNIPNDSRLDYRLGDIPNYNKLYEEGDVLVYPRKYGGQSLSLNEALSSGMAIIMTAVKPQIEFLPKELLIEPYEVNKIRTRREIEIASINPRDIANKIDEIAHKNITKYSKISNQIAKTISWETLLPEYEKILRELCG